MHEPSLKASACDHLDKERIEESTNSVGLLKSRVAIECYTVIAYTGADAGEQLRVNTHRPAEDQEREKAKHCDGSKGEYMIETQDETREVNEKRNLLRSGTSIRGSPSASSAWKDSCNGDGALVYLPNAKAAEVQRWRQCIGAQSFPRLDGVYY